MPAPKAVLRDLNDFGMDPAKPWSVTHNKTGRLNPTPKPNAQHTGLHLNQVKFEPSAKAAEAVKPVEKPTPAPKPALVRPVAKVAPPPVAEPVKEEPKVEVVKAEEVKVEEPEAEKPAS